MGTYFSAVRWARRPTEAFVDLRYSRAHTWSFDGGVTVPASSSAHVVPLPYSTLEAVDPEEALVAALSSCHLLTFLWLAAKAGFIVDAYEDDAVGEMGRNAKGRQAITTVRLRPKVVFAGEKVPTEAEVEALHHASHDECYIANSVTTAIVVEGSWAHRGAPASS